MRFPFIFILAALLMAAVPCHALTGPRVGSGPRLQEVQVWYQPAGDFPPVLVKHWVKGKLKVDRLLDYYGQDGNFRLVARLAPATTGRVMFVFEDAEGHHAGLPRRLQQAPGGFRDVEFRLPPSFTGGGLTLYAADGSGAPSLKWNLGTYVYCVPTGRG